MRRSRDIAWIVDMDSGLAPSAWPGMTAAALRLADGFEHRGVERLARALAGPDHELERLEIALRGVERGIQQRLALPARDLDAAGEQQRVTEHHDAVLGPHVEVADPELLVDQRDQREHFGAPRFVHLEVERAGEA